MGQNKLTRHEARETVFKLLFAREFDLESAPDAIYDAFVDITESKTNDYVHTTFVGACEKIGDIDTLIESSSVNWKLSRMSTATKSVLRLAVYEMTETETPVKVVINEAVEIAKKYESPETVKFMNGILGTFLREEIKE